MAIRTKIIGEIQKTTDQSFVLVKKIERQENPFKKQPPALAKTQSLSKILLLNLYNLKFDIERAIVEGYINNDFDFSQAIDKKFLLFYLYQKLDSSNYFSTFFEPLKKSTFEYKHCAFSKLLAEFLSSSEGKNFLLNIKHFVLSSSAIKKLKESKLACGRKSLDQLQTQNVFLTKEKGQILIKKHVLEFKEGKEYNLDSNYALLFFSSASAKKVVFSSTAGQKTVVSFKNNQPKPKAILIEEQFGWQGFRITPKVENSLLFFELIDFQLHYPKI
ncbi:MAG: hypothetical protein N3D10_01105 [Candidatus Micrarchaeota archaeon]|nr:hypothetical protein [Candidatus Micrarchaeota archaeon]